MNRTCNHCGRIIEGEGMAFCPYCGEKLAEQHQAPEEALSEAEEKWIRKAMAVASYPERKKILQKGLEECPDSRALEWEMLFIGEQPKKRPRSVDFSIIKSYVLEIYWKPGDFSEEQRDAMRSWFFDAPALVRCLNRFENPEDKQREYLLRLCREYVELFLEGSNQVMGSLFGFRMEKNKEKKVAEPVAEMIARIRKDEKLLPQQREQLWKALYQSYAAWANGKTEYLDERLDS